MSDKPPPHVLEEFPWQVSLGRLPVIWQDQGSEWLHYFSRHLGPALTSPGMGFDATTRPFVAIKLAHGAANLDGRVLVGDLGSEALLLVVAKEPLKETELAEISSAAATASTSLGSEGGAFEWSAVIGYQPHRIVGGETRLAAPVEVGGMRLESSEVVLVEELRGETSMFAVVFARSVPVIVYGTHQGYSVAPAMRMAAADLYRLCCLLSIAWDGCYVVREGPQPMSFGPRQVPADLPASLADSHEPKAEDLTAVEVPNWVINGWTRLAASRRIADAASAFHEGLRATHRHPSLALVAFIAAVEGVAGMLFKDRHCETCNARRYMKARFQETLRLVVDDQEAAYLGAAYRPRSKTVHAGTMHADETTPGHVFGLEPWQGPNDAFEFRWHLLRKLEGAARKLLTVALRDDLPAKRAFDPGE